MTLSSIQIHHACEGEINLDWIVKRAKEISMATLLPEVSTFSVGGSIDGLSIPVADIWAAFPSLGGPKLDDGYTPAEVAEAQRQFASDVRVAAKRNREDAAYDRIQELR